LQLIFPTRKNNCLQIEIENEITAVDQKAQKPVLDFGEF
jgi:hypothetical protein